MPGRGDFPTRYCSGLSKVKVPTEHLGLKNLFGGVKPWEIFGFYVDEKLLIFWLNHSSPKLRFATVEISLTFSVGSDLLIFGTQKSQVAFSGSKFLRTS